MNPRPFSLPSFSSLASAAALAALPLAACEPLENTLAAANLNRVLFMSDRDGQAEIYSASSQGTDLRRITNDRLDDRKPCWTWFHSRVAFVRGGELFTVFADGSDTKQLTAGKGRVDEPACSPDGMRLAFSRLADNNYDIWAIDTHGQGEVRLTSDAATDDAPAWSPDGSRIAFLSDRTGSNQIFVMDADGRNVRQLTDAGEHGAPAWSSDDRIVFWEEGANAPAAFVIVDPDGGRRALAGVGGFGENPSWAPDGRSFLFQMEDASGTMDVFRYDLASGQSVRFIVGAKAWNAEASWQIE